VAGILTPPRRRGVEILDLPDTDPEVVTRSLRDVACSNALFGGLSSAIDELKDTFTDLPRCATLLDVGTGLGDIPCRARSLAAQHSVDIETIGLDSVFEVARASAQAVSFAVCGNALSLPFADRSIDVVMCSQVLHHFAGSDAVTLLREMNRVAKVRVVVSDLRRSWIAVAGLWLFSFPLRFHAVSRHDGVVSVLRGFTPEELVDTVNDAVAQKPVVHRRRGFRITASWAPAYR
jgi:SAM-dependent methyltransferase